MNLEKKDLIGLEIENALWDKESIYLVLLDGRVIKMEPEGDCCAHAYIASVNNPEALKVSEILSIEDLEFNSEEEEGNCLDIWGHRINTTNGTCVIDCRTSHNGYYCGWLKFYFIEAKDLPENVSELKEMF